MSTSVSRRFVASFENLERRRLLSASTFRVIEYDVLAGTEQVLEAGQHFNASDAAVLDASLASEGFAGGLDALLASLGSPDEFLADVDACSAAVRAPATGRTG